MRRFQFTGVWRAGRHYFMLMIKWSLSGLETRRKGILLLLAANVVCAWSALGDDLASKDKGLTEAFYSLERMFSVLPPVKLNYTYKLRGMDYKTKKPITRISNVSTVLSGNRFFWQDLIIAPEGEGAGKIGYLASDGSRFQFIPWNGALMVTKDFAKLPLLAEGVVTSNPLLMPFLAFSSEGRVPFVEVLGNPGFWLDVASRVESVEHASEGGDEVLSVTVRKSEEMKYKIKMLKSRNYYPLEIEVISATGGGIVRVLDGRMVEHKEGRFWLPKSIVVTTNKPLREELREQESIETDMESLQVGSIFADGTFVISPAQAISFKDLDLDVEVDLQR